MELAKRTEAVGQPRHPGVSPVVRSKGTIGESSTVDHDVARAWDLKTGLQWVRSDGGPVNGFRWFLCDRFGLGRPPSRVEQRPIPDTLMDDDTSIAPTLRLVTPEWGASGGVGSLDESPLTSV
jgi:hypothetical protein